MRHYTRVEDFTKDEYFELCRRTKYFVDGLKRNQDFTDLCPGKVMATMFFQESARTSSSLQSAMIALGGDWLGIAGVEGTYIGSGEEGLDDFLKSYALVSDVMAVRHKELDLETIKSDFPVPLINAMCGKSEHPFGALGWVCTLSTILGDLAGIKIGIYGMAGASRPSKALVKAMSYFKPTIYIDSVIPEFGLPDDIIEFAKANGAKIINEPIGNFINEIDFLNIVEGLPQAGTDEDTINKFNEKYQVLTVEDISKMKDRSYFMYVMPAKMTDGRSVCSPELDKNEKNIIWRFLAEWKPTAMALITFLLGVKLGDKSDV